MTADYLEAVEAESDYDDEGMTPSDRARHFLSRDRLDEDAEVGYLLISAMRLHRSNTL